MDIKQNRLFIEKTETLVKPEDVIAISFLGDFNRILPLSLQRKIMKKGSRKVPYMGFVVDPYCFFVSYEVKDPKAAEALLPEGFELMETSLFEGDKKKFCMLLGSFTARTSAFIGLRMEAYLIARRKSDGKAAWIIVDYATNTTTYDPATGFSGYNGEPALFTTTPYGELLIDIGKKDGAQRLALEADITKGTLEKLDYGLWVEGNLTVDYGGTLLDASSSPFSLIFDPFLMEKALKIPPAAVRISHNGFFPDLIDADRPVGYACFPFSQHFIIKQDLLPGDVRTAKNLEDRIEEFIAAKGIKTMRGEDLKKPIFTGMLISAIVTYGVIVFLCIKVFL